MKDKSTIAGPYRVVKVRKFTDFSGKHSHSFHIRRRGKRGRFGEWPQDQEMTRSRAKDWCEKLNEAWRAGHDAALKEAEAGG